MGQQSRTNTDVEDLSQVCTSRARAHSRFQELKCYCNLNIFTTDVEIDGM